MTNLNGHHDALTCTNTEIGSTYSAYNILFILTGLAVSTYALARFVESKNQLIYESRLARIIAGSLKLMVNMLHTSDRDLEIDSTNGALITAGPHRTGWEGFVIASKIKGAPPRFFATDTFNAIPGVSHLMKIFKAIPIEAKATKDTSNRSANFRALEEAGKTLTEKGCVAIFPQGNFSKKGQKPPRVYEGAARLAVKHQIPIHVIRLDGYWCLENPLIPLFVRNSAYYRAFLSGFHMNNVRATLCSIIDFHLQPENNNLSDEDKIEEICAQLYAYYRHTEELSTEQIEKIKTQISNKEHRPIWRNRVEQDVTQKKLISLEREAQGLEEACFLPMP